MEIIINGKPAALKKNTSFDYISENSMFTGSDSYTLSITFPLKDCPQNIAIFGNIYRQDVDKSKVVFDCDIRDREFFHSGSIIITQINEMEVKTQFLEGRSEQNFNDSFDDVYLNEMHLGYPADRTPANNDINSAWHSCYPNVNWVPLPWVNNYSGNLQNSAVKDGNGDWAWNSAMTTLTFQPYLLYILNRICQEMGYTGNFSSILNSDWSKLLICNTLPWTWEAWNFAIALPHWSLTEFFEQLEMLMGGEFSINHKAKTISFEFSHVTAYNTPAVKIDKVISKYTVDVSQEQQSEYIGALNLAYAENDSRFWAYRSCRWYIDAHAHEAVYYNTLAELLQWAETQRESGVYISGYSGHTGPRYSYVRGYPSAYEAHKLFYVRDEDAYFIMFCYRSEYVYTSRPFGSATEHYYYRYYNRLECINQFGKRITNKNAEERELNIVPAWIDDTDDSLGPCLFLDCGEMGENVSWEVDENGTGTSGGGSDSTTGSSSGFSWNGSGARTTTAEEDDTEYDDGALAQTRAGKAIAKGEQEKSDAYFDKIYVGFWDGINRRPSRLPKPIIHELDLDNDFTVAYMPYSLAINKVKDSDQNGIPMKYFHDIDNRKKYNFSFLSDTIPDPHAIFYIEGSRYICEKITATFHEDSGKSQLLKGVFYKLAT